MPSRERPRPARRRIAGERTRPPELAPAEREEGLATEAASAKPSGEPPAPTEPQQPREHPAAPERPVEDGSAAAAPASDRAAAPDTPAGEGPAAGAQERVRTPPPVGTDERGGPPRWALAVLAGLLAVALALDGFVVWRELDQRQQAEEAARALHSALIEAPSVAERAAESVLSFRHDTVDKDVAEARRFLTADYAPAYISSIRDVVADPAGEVRATVEAQVLSSGVVEAGDGRADVLLFVNQVTRSVGQPPQTALNRVVFTMVSRDGAWRVDEIRAF